MKDYILRGMNLMIVQRNKGTTTKLMDISLSRFSLHNMGPLRVQWCPTVHKLSIPRLVIQVLSSR